MSPSKKQRGHAMKNALKFCGLTVVLTTLFLIIGQTRNLEAGEVKQGIIGGLDFREKIRVSEEIKEMIFSHQKIYHENLKGIYITAYTAVASHFDELIDQLIASGGNMVVMDIELSGGELAFEPKDEKLKSINPGNNTLADLKEIIWKLHKKDIYVVARQVVFNDPYTAEKKPEWRIHYEDGSLYDARWLDPSHPEVQEYNLQISREVAEFGFDEIQYDYIRFPDGYHRGLNYVYDETTMERWQVINDFLKKAKTVLEEYDVKLGVDVFGATIWGELDWTLVGQYIPEIAKTVDVIYPMAYPSHIAPGYNGFQNPYGEPYSFIYDSIEKFIEAADGNAEIRPWIQGFPLHIPNFGPWFMNEQVRGTYEAGANDFVIWSPGNRYTMSWESLSMPVPERTPEMSCKVVGGEWTLFMDTCGNQCESAQDPNSLCGQGEGWACACGEGECWNGSRCEALTSAPLN